MAKAAPTSIRICGKDYTVEWVEGDDIDGEVVGHVSGSKCLIRVALGPCLQQKRDTLLHEVLHALWTETGITENLKDTSEEQIIRPFATALLSTLRDNPDFVHYLLSK